MAEPEGYGFDDGTSIVGVMIGPGKTYVNNRVWRRADGFRVRRREDSRRHRPEPDDNHARGRGDRRRLHDGRRRRRSGILHRNRGAGDRRPDSELEDRLQEQLEKNRSTSRSRFSARSRRSSGRLKGLSKAFSALTAKFDATETRIPLDRPKHLRSGSWPEEILATEWRGTAEELPIQRGQRWADPSAYRLDRDGEGRSSRYRARVHASRRHHEWRDPDRQHRSYSHVGAL